MLGQRKPQVSLFDVGNVFELGLPASSFYAQLATAHLFRDEDFAVLYSARLGRPSVPPSQLAVALILQQHDGVSDEEAIERTAYDLRWNAALGRFAGQPLCAKSTLQLFRAHLILHEQAKQLFVSSIEAARRAGLLKGALRIAIDTKPVLCMGAVVDTFNLLSLAILKLAYALAAERGQPPADFLEEQGLSRYAAPSVKGSTDIDWSEDKQKKEFLSQIVSDARGLLALCAGATSEVREAADLLCALLLQDIEPAPAAPAGGGCVETAEPPAEEAVSAPAPVQVKKETVHGRIPSLTDPEARHGRKSASKTFTGHKASVAVDIDSQIIVAVDILAGDAPDNTGALELTEQAEATTGLPVMQTLGDCAYGDGATRQKFVDAERDLHAKVPKDTFRDGMYPKSDFAIDVENKTVTCPAGHTVSGQARNADGSVTVSFKSFCGDCPLRSVCTKSQEGRTIRIHPQEQLLQDARAYQKSSQGKQHLRQRVAIEHALARLAHLGIGQARYAGRIKTRFQLLMAATVANLRRTWNWTAQHNAKPADFDQNSASGVRLQPLQTQFRPTANLWPRFPLIDWRTIIMALKVA